MSQAALASAPSTVAPPALSMTGLSKNYDSAVAIDGIDFDIAAGEFVTLLGPSGSGKTTLLNLLAGFIRADAGQIRVNGTDVTPLPAYRRGFGVVFQNYALFPHLSVRDNIAFPLRLRRMKRPAIDVAVADVLDLVGLADYGPRRINELSGGQQQRIALARAVVFKPPVLLMDESLSALDKNLRQEMQQELRRLQRQLGLTVVFVTHDQEEALAMSDRIAVMERGRLVQAGSGRDLYERPRAESIARFFGEANILTGEVVRASGGLAVKVAGVPMPLPAGVDVALGSRVTVLVRSNRVHLADGAGANRVQARVTDATYLGQSVRLQLALPGGTAVVARLNSAGREPRVGDDVDITWDSDAAAILAPEAGVR